MIRTAHGEAWFSPDIRERVLELMKFQCSAMRSAYQASTKHKLKGNDIVLYVKKNYMEDLNQRYIKDACSISKLFSVNEGVHFGGKKNWEKVKSGEMSREEWQSIRNSQLYSTGDKTKSGNPNIRIKDGGILINDPSSRGKWIEGKLFLPEKFNPDYRCYSVRLLHRNGKFKVIISWEETTESIPVREGSIGVDCNPDGVAISELDGDGNLVSHRYIKKQRIQFASSNKRDYDVRELAKEVVNYAKDKSRPVVIEKLDFRKGKKSYKKFNRMKSNFLYRKILDAIKGRAMKLGVPILEVNPAFTSVLGKLKYRKMYSLNDHSSAAMVIGRRGMEMKEREDFTVSPSPKKKGYLNLEGRGCSIALTGKAFSWLVDGFLRPKPSTLTGSVLAAGSRPSTGTSVGETPTGESCPITGRTRLINHQPGYGRSPVNWTDLPSFGRFVHV